MIKFKVKNKCRLCLSKNIELVVKLPTTVPGEHLKKHKRHKNTNLIPIDLYLCKTCGHVQLIHVPSPKDGTVKKICIEDSQPVEYGQVLVMLD